MRPFRLAKRRALFHPSANEIPATAIMIGHQIPSQITGTMQHTPSGIDQAAIPVGDSVIHSSTRFHRGKCKSEWYRFAIGESYTGPNQGQQWHSSSSSRLHTSRCAHSPSRLRIFTPCSSRRTRTSLNPSSAGRSPVWRSPC